MSQLEFLPARCLGSEDRWQKNVGWEKAASRSCSELATLAWLCAQRDRGGVIFVALTVMALSLFLMPRRASWVRQVHPGEWKQASWLCFCMPLPLITSQAHKSWFDHFKNQNDLRLFTLTRSECMTPLLACLYVCLKFAYWSRSAAHMCCTAFQTSIHPDRRNAADMSAWYLHMVSVHCQLQTFKSTVRWLNPEPGCL